MEDPTMRHVGDVKAYVANVVKHCSMKPEVEWLDEWTAKLTLPKGWSWA